MPDLARKFQQMMGEVSSGQLGLCLSCPYTIERTEDFFQSRHENSRRHGRHAWGTTLIELRNQISLLPCNRCFCLTLVQSDVRLSIWGCLHDVSSCIWPQFEAATMILPLNFLNPDEKPIFTCHFEEPKKIKKSCLRNQQAQFSCLFQRQSN